MLLISIFATGKTVTSNAFVFPFAVALSFTLRSTISNAIRAFGFVPEFSIFMIFSFSVDQVIAVLSVFFNSLGRSKSSLTVVGIVKVLK